MGAAEKLQYTLDEYLEMGALDNARYEFYEGEVYPALENSIPHNQVVGNVFGTMFGFLKGKPCNAFTSTQKVQVKKKSFYCEPDIVVVCGEIETMETHKDIITNPVLLIEVLSPASKDYDRGEKFKLFRNIPTLQEYICISSMEMLVEKYDRKAEHIWTITEIKPPIETLFIDTIGMPLLLADIYNGVNVEIDQ